MLRRNYETIATLLLIFLLPVNTQSVAASSTSTWWTHFIYIFFHANVFHLAANLYALWFIRAQRSRFIISCFIAIIVSFITPYPIVGFSTVIYSMWGMNMLQYSRNTWLIFLAINLITILLPGIGWIAHFSAFSLGLFYSYLNQLSNEYRRACKGR